MLRKTLWPVEIPHPLHTQPAYGPRLDLEGRRGGGGGGGGGGSPISQENRSVHVISER